MVSQEVLNHFNVSEEEYKTIMHHASLYKLIRNYSRVTEENKPSTFNKPVFCNVCNRNQKNYSRHIKSTKHLENVANAQ